MELTLCSHPGLAIVPRTAKPLNLFIIIDYVALGVGEGAGKSARTREC